MKLTRTALLETLNTAFLPAGSSLEKPPIKADPVSDPLWPVTAPDDTKIPKGRAELKVAMSHLLDTVDDADVDETFKGMKAVFDEKQKKEDQEMTNTGKKIEPKSGTSAGLKRIAESALRAKIREILVEGPRGHGGYSAPGNWDDTYALGSLGSDDRPEDDGYDPYSKDVQRNTHVAESGGIDLRSFAEELGISISGVRNAINKVLAVYAVKVINDRVQGENMDPGEWNQFKGSIFMPPEDAVTICNILTKTVAVVVSSFLDDNYTFEEIKNLLDSDGGRDTLRDEIETDESLTDDEKMFALEVLERDDIVLDLPDSYGGEMKDLGREAEKFFDGAFLKEFGEKPRQYLLDLGLTLNAGIARGGAASDA